VSNAADVESYWLKLCRIPEFRLSLQYNLTIKLTVEIFVLQRRELRVECGGLGIVLAEIL